MGIVRRPHELKGVAVGAAGRWHVGPRAHDGREHAATLDAAPAVVSGLGWPMRTLVLVSIAALLAVLVPPAPAAAVTVRTHDTQRVLGDISSQRIEIRSGGGTARGTILRFPETSQDIDMRPRLANGTIATAQGKLPMARRELQRGAVAGINGGYWLARPWAVPNGLHVDRGQLLTGQSLRSSVSTARAARGMVGWTRNGPLTMDIIDVQIRLTRTQLGTPSVVVDDLNRQPLAAVDAAPSSGQLILYTDRFGTEIRASAGAQLVFVEGLSLTSVGASEGRVVNTRRLTSDARVTVPAGQQVLLADGPRVADLRDAFIGESMRVATGIIPEATDEAAWRDLWGGVAGGQLLVRGGQRQSVLTWSADAAFSNSHATGRQPRTVIARTGNGRVLLVTIDGRRAGWSDGIALRDLADALLQLGVTDAVNLDGGGSSTMTINAQVRNRPSENGRTIADGLFLYVTPPAAARSLGPACPSQLRAAGAGFTDVNAGATHADAIGCLAGWGVTSGVTPTTYEPGGPVTRAQMATFLARWIDDHAARGSGATLPEAPDQPFADVAEGGVHGPSIARLAAVGIVTGRTSSTYDPSSPVTRAQTATMVSRAIAHVTGSPLPDGRDTFVDDNDLVHEPNIDRLAATGIVSGTGGFAFTPAAPVTRAAMASLLMRASAYLVEFGVAVVPDEIITSAVDGDDEVADVDSDGDDDADGDDVAREAGGGAADEADGGDPDA